MADRATLLRQHGELTVELASQVRARGAVRATVIRTRAQTWWSTQDMAVTERRETCTMAVADLESRVADMDGEIDALRAELSHIEWEIENAGA